VAYRVVFSPEARGDLTDLYLYIAERSGGARAMGFVERIEARWRDRTRPKRGARTPF